MKAMVLRAPRDLRIAEVERPTLGQDQVLVRVTHSGICGTDLKIFKGAIPVRYPLIMGHEMVGEVVEGGDDSLRPGDRVIVDPVNYCGTCFNCRAGQTNLCPNGALLGRDTDGGFADYIVAPRSHVFPLPDAIESQVAPLIQVLTTCLHAHRLIKTFSGQSVVVMGLGVPGKLHVQLAKAWGASPVIGITRSAWKRILAEELGRGLHLAGRTGRQCAAYWKPPADAAPIWSLRSRACLRRSRTRFPWRGWRSDFASVWHHDGDPGRRCRSISCISRN